MKKLITHEGGFHADDVMAYAILKEVLSRKHETWTLTRTRDLEIINTGDIVFDIGEEYDHARCRYDHHQRGRAGIRNNGVLYAAAGLIWKHYGRELCTTDAVWYAIENDMICELDAIDNGQDFNEKFTFAGTRNYPLAIMIGNFESTMYEDKDPGTIQSQFEEASEFARGVLVRAIHSYEAQELAFKEVSATYHNSTDKEILVFEKNYERPIWKRLAVFPEVVYAIYPKTGGDSWKVEGIPKTPFVLESRKCAPDSWRGLRSDDLRKVTGVADATFCHPSGFLFGAVSRDGAVELAKKSLSEK